MSKRKKNSEDAGNNVTKKANSKNAPCYVIRYIRSTEVTDWDNSFLNEVETCSGSPMEAMGYVTGEAFMGEVSDPMLVTPGLRKEDGIHGTAFGDISMAEKGQKECLEALLENARADIRKICAITKEQYIKIPDEIAEYPDRPGDLPESAKVAGEGEIGCRIAWGTNSEITWAPANIRTAEHCHKYLPACNEICTDITVWIEKLDFVC